MLTLEQSADIVAPIRDRVRDAADDEDIVRTILEERGVNTASFNNLRMIAGLTLGESAVALTDAAVLAGVVLGQAALKEQETV